MDKSMKWTQDELLLLGAFKSPVDIQSYLDQIPYSSDPIYRSPRRVLRDRKAHCFDGAVFAAAALEHLGFPPMLMELKAVRDDDHLLALFQIDKCWGAVAKSNFVGLRYREPIHRNLRELAISYFHSYFNVAAEKTLRSYSVMVKLSMFEKYDWHFNDEAMDRMDEHLTRIRHYPLISDKQTIELAPIDSRTLQAEMLGINKEGLYKPGGKNA